MLPKDNFRIAGVCVIGKRVRFPQSFHDSFLVSLVSPYLCSRIGDYSCGEPRGGKKQNLVCFFAGRIEGKYVFCI